MARSDLSGVESVITGLTSDKPSNASAARPRKVAAKGDRGQRPQASSTFKPIDDAVQSAAPGGPQLKGRIGRPPGQQTNAKSLKFKATAYVSADLKDIYIEWSYEERCSIGELIERAMIDYHRRQRPPTAKS